MDPARISAIGWSFGGGAVLAALAGHRRDELGLARVIIYYPSCEPLPPWTSDTPVFMLLAGADDVAPARGCKEVVRRAAPPGSVRIVVYADARHAFDFSELPAIVRLQAGTPGHHPTAAADAEREIDRFLAAGAPGAR